MNITEIDGQFQRMNDDQKFNVFVALSTSMMFDSPDRLAELLKECGFNA